MKYIKAQVDYKIEEQPHSKITLIDAEDFRESPWIAKPKDQDHVVLLNHALLFLPFSSWGVILPTTGSEFNVAELQEKRELLLHPDAFDTYLEKGVIDAEGNYLIPTNFKEEQE